MQKNHKERHVEWQRFIAEHQKSGLSQKDFCKERGLSLPQFVYYNCLFKSEGNPLTTVPASFAPVKLSVKENNSPSSEIKLSLPNGFQCVLPSHLESIQIKRWMEVLLSC
jgi:hypothetical protein